jgi:hypothetical protein
MIPMDVAYDLRKDAENIKHMQRAMLSDGPIGLQNAHGLIGADECDDIGKANGILMMRCGVGARFPGFEWLISGNLKDRCGSTRDSIMRFPEARHDRGRGNG